VTTETYTPGHDQRAANFMAERTLASHGAFFLPYLAPGLAVLDCGCGPGSITVGIAARSAPGEVVGIDFAQSQVDRATAAAAQQGLPNVRFEAASAYAMPFPSNQFDRVFSHALLEHLADPVRALRELHRVLKPGGAIGVCSPDWDGFLIAPPSAELAQAIAAYRALQAKNGGDVAVGQKLGLHLAAAGFATVRLSARYECYPALALIGEYLAAQLERAGDERAAAVLHTWSQQAGGLFAQAWVAAVGVKPT
jgi:SAM-dependent methyltransferase